MNSALHLEQVPGDHLGLVFPTTPEQLLAQGARFLTSAFRACGVLDTDNSVQAITTSEEFFGGGAGRKLAFSVRYARTEAGLQTELFAKFPRDFGDPLRDLFSPLMVPEVHFALLSRGRDFPVRVPRCYFADYHAASGSSLLITERIAFGRGGIEAHQDKCLDYQLPAPLEHYQALVDALARLSGQHQSGRLGAAFDQAFPYPGAGIKATDRIPYDHAGLDGKLAKLRRFVLAQPQLFPAALVSPAFLDNFARDAHTVLDNEALIHRHLNADPRYVALCHWNANIDNAWFWRNAEGRLAAGLLDWGSVGQMNLGQALFGLLCAAEPEFLIQHRDRLLQRFATAHAEQGGRALEPTRLRADYLLAVAVLGIAWMLDAPSLIEHQLGDTGRLLDRHDPALRDDFLARAQLHLLTVLLSEWQAAAIGANLPRLLALPRG